MSRITERKYVQVLNGAKVPASGPHNDLAIFASEIDAESWMDYLVEECGNEDEYTTREVIVSLPLTYPANEDDIFEDTPEAAIESDWGALGIRKSKPGATTYASTAWTAEDVQELRSSWTLERCERELQSVSKYIQDRSIAAGWEVLESELPEE